MSQIRTNSIVPSGGVVAGATGGGIIQVVQDFITTSASTTSTSLVQTGLSATITPRSTSNKILIWVNGIGSAGGTDQVAFQMRRGTGTNIANQATSINFSSQVTCAVCEGQRTRQPLNFCLLDEPGTTSATTYHLYWRTSSGTGLIGRWGVDDNWRQSTNLTLMEISG